MQRVTALFEKWTKKCDALTLVMGRIPLGWVIFAAALAVFVFIVPFGDFDSIIGDNMAQVGYWRVLFHREFVGSIGASSMKPLLILLFGATFDLSAALFDSSVLFRVIFALTASALVAVVSKIAEDIGGRAAAVAAAAYLVLCTSIPGMYTHGTSMIFFLPLLLWGVRLFGQGRQQSGTVVLCVTATVRIEALAVLCILALTEQLLKRRFRELAFTVAAVVVTVLFTAGFYYALQGSVARFNAGGPPVGYLFNRDPDAVSRLVNALEYLRVAPHKILTKDWDFPNLVIPALVGIWVSPMRRQFLSIVGVPLFILTYVATGQGLGEVRYFEFLLPVVAAFGAGGLFYCLQRAAALEWRNLAIASACLVVATYVLTLGGNVETSWKSLGLLLGAAGISFGLEQLRVRQSRAVAWVTATLVLVAAYREGRNEGRWRNERRAPHYLTDARRLIKKRSLVPRGVRVMLEDDMIYGVLVNAPDRFSRMFALQAFNIMDDAQREKKLAEVDFVVVSRYAKGYYYLAYDPARRRRRDPFRAMVRDAERDDIEPVNLYGVQFELHRRSDHFIVLKVNHEGRHTDGS